MKWQTYFLLILVFSFFACGESVDKTLLAGTWNGVEWVVEGQRDAYDATLASFTFEPEGRYAYTYNGATEKGDYYVTNRELYTTPDGGVKMMVRIRTLSPDSLVFDMNRGGMAERLKLLRAR